MTKGVGTFEAPPTSLAIQALKILPLPTEKRRPNYFPSTGAGQAQYTRAGIILELGML